MHSHTTSEGGSYTARDETTQHTQSQDKRIKRFQACVACRATKTKCLPSARSDSCQSCVKNSRPCVMPGPPKPRIKSSQKFSELERKIELLTNALAAKEHDPQNLPDTVAHNSHDTNTHALAASSRESSPVDEHSDGRGQSITESPKMSAFHETQVDVVDEGLIRKETATALFLHWKTYMHPFMPLVFVEKDIGIDHLRNTRPMVFLTILTIASAAVYPSLSNELVKRLTHALGRCAFVQNEPSVDAASSVLLFSQYYFRTDKSTTLPSSQYVYTAIAMVLDLGLHTKAKDVLNTNSSASAEAAQICLSEWYAASMLSVLLNRSPIVQHSRDLEEYTAILHRGSQSPRNWTLSLYKLQQIVERAALLLNPFDNKDPNAFDEPSTQYKINMLQQQLDSWRQDLPEDVDERFKRHAFHTAYLRIHAIAIRCFVRKVMIEKQERKNRTQHHHDEGLMGLTPTHFDCLTKCITSVRAVFDVYLSLDILVVRSLPNSYLFWNMSAAVLLLKLGHFGEVLTKHERQTASHGTPSQPFKTIVLYYLDSVTSKMEQAARGEHLPQAKAYIRVLRKLKPYYLHKRAVCISQEGEAVAVEDDSCPHVPFTYSVKQTSAGRSTPPTADVQMQSDDHNLTYRHSPTHHHHHQQQAQSSTGGSLSHSGWTPSSISSQGPFLTPSTTGSHNDPFASSAMDVTAAYDPYTYANTDWTAFGLDERDFQQMDEFMWADDDISWMQSIL